MSALPTPTPKRKKHRNRFLAGRVHLQSPHPLARTGFALPAGRRWPERQRGRIDPRQEPVQLKRTGSAAIPSKEEDPRGMAAAPDRLAALARLTLPVNVHGESVTGSVTLVVSREDFDLARAAIAQAREVAS